MNNKKVFKHMKLRLYTLHSIEKLDKTYKTRTLA